MDTLAKLLAATREYHATADASLISLLHRPSIAGYRELLLDTYRWVAAIERAIARTPEAARIVDAELTTKTQLLVRDLVALGMRRHHIGAIDTYDAVPQRFASASEAMGWLFTIERSTLLHDDLHRELAKQYPAEMASAASFLTGAFSARGESWRRFGALLDDELGAVIAAASVAFETYQRCCGGFAAAS